MKNKIYEIKDDVTGFDGNIMLLENDEDAKRVFALEVNNEESIINKWHKDYSIWAAGERDRITGEIKSEQPRLVARATSLLRATKKEE